MSDPRDRDVLGVEWSLGSSGLDARLTPPPAGRLVVWQGGRPVTAREVGADGSCHLDVSALDAASDAFLWHETGTGPPLFLDRIPAPERGTGTGPAFRRRSLARIAVLRPGAAPTVNGRPVPSSATEDGGTLLTAGMPETLWPQADGAGRAEAFLRTDLRPVHAVRALLAGGRAALVRLGDAPPAPFAPLRLHPTAEGMGLIGTWMGDARPVLLDVGAIRDLAPRAAWPHERPAAAAVAALRSATAGEPPLTAPPTVTVLPSRSGEALPRFGGRCVLLRPGHAPTDDLYVSSGWAILSDRHGWEYVVADQSSEEALGDPRFLRAGDLVVVTRTITEPWFRRLAARRDRIRIAYVMDDDVTVAAATASLPPEYRARMDEVARVDFPAMLRLCHHLVVTSDHLARRFASPKTRLLHPPCLRFPADLSHHDRPGPFRIALHATGGHRDDVAFLWPVLEEVAREFGEAVEIEVISGEAPASRLPNLRVLRQMPWPDYVAHVARKPAHLFAVPVLPTAWNAAKSIVKMHDAVALGAAGVFSDVAPYRGVVREGVEGFLTGQWAGEWDTRLSHLLADRRLARTAAHHALARAREAFTPDRLARRWAGLVSGGRSGELRQGGTPGGANPS